MVSYAIIALQFFKFLPSRMDELIDIVATGAGVPARVMQFVTFPICKCTVHYLK